MKEKIEYLLTVTFVIGTVTGIIPTLLCAGLFNILGF